MTLRSDFTSTHSITDGDPADASEHIVVGNRFQAELNEDTKLGMGRVWVAYRGVDVLTGEAVAVKVRKPVQDSHRAAAAEGMRREVRTLQQLHSPGSPPSDPRLRCAAAAGADPADLFVQLKGCTKDGEGRPGVDPESGQIAIVLQLGHYTLRDFLKERAVSGEQLARNEIAFISRCLLTAVAAMQARGLAHFDLKPRNLMYFGDGRWKIIDFEGCARLGAVQSMQGIPITPLYCPPEWARARIRTNATGEHEEGLVGWRHDGWSIAITILELVTLKGVMRDVVAHSMSEAKQAKQDGGEPTQRTDDEARQRSDGQPKPKNEGKVGFVRWLATVEHMQLPPKVAAHPQSVFFSRLSAALLTCDAAEAKTVAEVLEGHVLDELEDGLADAKRIFWL